MKLIIILALSLSACAAQRTTITRDGKVIWEITGTGDQLVEVSMGENEKVKIDSRKSSTLRDLLNWSTTRMLSNPTAITK